MVSLTRHSVPQWFGSWVSEHYDFRTPPVSGEANVICKRCGDIVWGTLKHARNVHGDDVPDIGPHPAHVAQGWLSDERGHLVRI